jgi:hypothetical protein
LLKCSQFSVATALAVLKIIDLENGREQIPNDDVAKIEELLEAADGIFMGENDDGPSVRLKKGCGRTTIPIDQLNASNDDAACKAAIAAIQSDIPMARVGLLDEMQVMQVRVCTPTRSSVVEWELLTRTDSGRRRGDFESISDPFGIDIRSPAGTIHLALAALAGSRDG